MGTNSRYRDAASRVDHQRVADHSKYGYSQRVESPRKQRPRGASLVAFGRGASPPRVPTRAVSPARVRGGSPAARARPAAWGMRPHSPNSPHSPHSPHRSPPSPHRSPHQPNSPHSPPPPDSPPPAPPPRPLHPQARKLAALLARNLARVIDIFRAWDTDEDGQLSKAEFSQGLASLQMGVGAADIDALFAHFDPDGSGALDFRELRSVLRDSAPSRGGDANRDSYSSLHAAMAAATESGWTTLART